MYRRLSHLALISSIAVLPFAAMHAVSKTDAAPEESQIARGERGGGGGSYRGSGGFDRGFDRGYNRGYDRGFDNRGYRGNWDRNYRNWDGNRYYYGVGVGVGVPYYDSYYGTPGYYGGSYYEDTPYYQGNYNSGMNPSGMDSGDAW